MTATLIGSVTLPISASTSSVRPKRSISQRPQEGHETSVGPTVLSSSTLRISLATNTSSTGSVVSDTRMVSP